MPSRPSPAQSQASRHNGALSKGPKTEAGKNRVAANAMTHGMRAETIELTDAEELFAQQLRNELSRQFRSTTVAERSRLEALILCEIKLARLDGLELRVLQNALSENDEDLPKRLPSLATLDRYRGRLMRERREIEAQLATDDDVNSSALTTARLVPGNDTSCTNKPEPGSSEREPRPEKTPAWRRCKSRLGR